MKDFILNNIVMIYKGTFTQKVSSTISLAVAPAFSLSVIERLTGWYIDNHIFITLAFLIIAIDHILGTWVHWTIKRDFKFNLNLFGLLKKIIIVSLGYTTLSIIGYSMRDIELLRDYFSATIQLITILYPGSSALSNMSIITNGRFPPTGLLDRIKNFNQSADINDLKTDNKNEGS